MEKSGCVTLSAVRRSQAILVIVALLAAPLALLARGMAGEMPGCTRACCLLHGPHSAHLPQPMTDSDGHGMACHHDGATRACHCLMRSHHPQMDFGFLAPIAPTHTSAIVRIAGPEFSRASFSQQVDISLPGFLSPPFQPPRN